MGPDANAPLRAGLRVSIASIAATLALSTTSIAVGVVSGSLVLVAFGVTGLLDGVGSAMLAVHFRHALRHEVISERREAFALNVVTIGLVVVGVATAIESTRRLVVGRHPDATLFGIALAAGAGVTQASLAARKRVVAPTIPSRALHADGWVSATSALLAVVTVAGTGLDKAFSLWWVDPLAALVVGAVAIGTGVRLRTEG